MEGKMMEDFKRKLAEVVLEELQNNNEKLAKLMKKHEERYTNMLEENEEVNLETFIEETVDVLMEHLGIDKEDPEPTAAESELERMRRLI